MFAAATAYRNRQHGSAGKTKVCDTYFSSLTLIRMMQQHEYKYGYIKAVSTYLTAIAGSWRERYQLLMLSAP
jgi:hypothetical protein